MNSFVISVRQFFFGLKLFFRKLSFKNYIKIITFIFKRFILNKNIPFSVVLAVTYECQCNCVHCFVSDYKTNCEELSKEELMAVIDSIDQLGSLKVTFFGGEPLIRKDIVELVSYATAKGIRTSVDTNGLLLDNSMVQALKVEGISNINVSIDSSEGAIHNKLRHAEDCFRYAIEGIKLCVAYNIPCLVSTYASKSAIKTGDLERIIMLSKKLKVNGVKVLLPILSGKWRECEKERLNSDEEKYVMSLMDPSFVYIEDALEMIKSKGKSCSALAMNLIYISPYGDIQPCPAIPISFGNIRKESMQVIMEKLSWHSFSRKFKGCRGCLMNENKFRNEFFSYRQKKQVPICVEDFKN